jgi:hypothetical protein
MNHDLVDSKDSRPGSNISQHNVLITESAFLELYHPRLYPAMLRAKIQKKTRQGFENIIGRFLEDFLLGLWLKNHSMGKWVEQMGLPRRSMEKRFGSSLSLEVDPNSLNNLVSFKNKYQRRHLGNRFIWDGDWDKRTRHFHDTERYQFLADIWENRSDLSKSKRFHELVSMYKKGRPYRSYHKGVYLDSEHNVYRFLNIYLTFMEQLGTYGYDYSLADDPVGVALDRQGKLIKINKGLHRLAMAQIVGLKEIPVQIRAVHRLWWDKNNSSQGIHLKTNFRHLISHLLK